MSMSLSHRTILLIISGGIAAYKSLDLIRRLKEEGACVRCILTDGGSQFITPLSVAALSGEPVFTNLFTDEQEQRMGHIHLSRTSDLVVVAPASANMMAKMATGMADSLASAILLACDKPVMVAPAMNCMMWQHPATQANLATLKKRNVKIVGPVCGDLACGEQGAGRMSEPLDILKAIKDHFVKSGPLAGKKALVTSGPTYEPIDPVRFIGNRSSGKQGHAIAIALAAQGAEVTLVTGPTALPDPSNITTLHVETATEMLAACQSSGPYIVAICAAAVADWRPKTSSCQKLKKNDGQPTIALHENKDILATLSISSPERPQLVIGFAAETDHLIDHAKEKFARKGCDWILANQVGADQGFGKDENEVTLIQRDQKGDITATPWPRGSKQKIAHHLVEAIIQQLSTQQE